LAVDEPSKILAGSMAKQFATNTAIAITMVT
jgi:hypothetical protein